MISVLVPFTPGACRHRDRAWDYVRERLEHFHPDWQIVVGTSPDPWSKGRAVADALTRADGDVLVMHDADSFVPAASLRDAVAAVEPGVWAMPHLQVHRINEGHTRALYAEGILDEVTLPNRGARTRMVYQGTVGGGVVAITRADYEACPIDPRFEGWGGEDDAWGRALCTLIGGTIVNNGPAGLHPPHRGDGNLWHLHHPLARTHRNREGVLPETNALVARYKECTGVPRLMRALVHGLPPEPLPELDRPATFRLRRSTLRIPAGKIRASADRLHTTTDPEVAEQLRAHRLAEEVTA